MQNGFRLTSCVSGLDTQSHSRTHGRTRACARESPCVCANQRPHVRASSDCTRARVCKQSPFLPRRIRTQREEGTSGDGGDGGGDDGGSDGNGSGSGGGGGDGGDGGAVMTVAVEGLRLQL